jgi:hypothetical protein
LRDVRGHAHLALPAVWVLGAALLGAAQTRAAIGTDLSYVDPGSPQYQRFHQWVDDALGGNPGYGFSATDAAYLYRLTGDPAYGSLAVDWAEAQVAAAEQAIAGGGRPEVAGDSYLQAGPMIRDVALVYDWCGPLLSQSQRTRYAAYAQQTIWNIWNPGQASWGGHPFPWSGWGTDDPGNNYHYSFLMATAYWALAADDPAWTSLLESEKFPALVAYFQQLSGGGSREGTGYGVALGSLFEVYQVWKDSTGEDLAAASSHLVDSIDYWIQATMPSLDRYAPVGDLARESYPDLYDYHRKLVLEARHLAPQGAPQVGRATWWLHHISIDHMTGGFNDRYDLLPSGTAETPPTDLSHHAAGVGHLFARSSWSSSALWLGVVAGPYDQSHAHQEQGGFTLFRGDFLAATENILSHSGIEQGTETNNVVRFELAGATVPQEMATNSADVSRTGGVLHVVADLSASFAGSGLVDSWQRTLDFDETGVTVDDVYSVAQGVTATFQVNTPVEPVVSNGVVTAGTLRITPILPAGATVTTLDWTSVDPAEFLSGWRVDIHGSGGEFLVRLDLLVPVFADGFESGDASAWSSLVP